MTVIRWSEISNELVNCKDSLSALRLLRKSLQADEDLEELGSSLELSVLRLFRKSQQDLREQIRRRQRIDVASPTDLADPDWLQLHLTELFYAGQTLSSNCLHSLLRPESFRLCVRRLRSLAACCVNSSRWFHDEVARQIKKRHQYISDDIGANLELQVVESLLRCIRRGRGSFEYGSPESYDFNPKIAKATTWLRNTIFSFAENTHPKREIKTNGDAQLAHAEAHLPSGLPQEQDRYLRALKMLEAEDAIIIALRWDKEMTIKQIAEKLGLSVGVATRRAKRALDRLRRLVALDGEDIS